MFDPLAYDLIERLRDEPTIATEDRRLCAEAADMIAKMSLELRDEARYIKRIEQERDKWKDNVDV